MYVYMHIYNMFVYYFWLHWISVAMQAFSSCSKGGLLSSVVCGLLTVVASVVAEQRPWSGQAPEVVVGRLSCPVACGIFFLTRD